MGTILFPSITITNCKKAMVKVPYISGHELVRLDKAIRTLQLRFLGKRRRRVASNVRRLHTHQRTAALSLSNSMDSTDLSSAGKERRGENGESASKWNGNGVDGSINFANDSTFDDVSINESSIASNDTMAEQHSEVMKKRDRRSLIHKLGGLFSSEKVISF
jgi:hypothetical protein